MFNDNNGHNSNSNSNSNDNNNDNDNNTHSNNNSNSNINNTNNDNHNHNNNNNDSHNHIILIIITIMKTSTYMPACKTRAYGLEGPVEERGGTPLANRDINLWEGLNEQNIHMPTQTCLLLVLSFLFERLVR